MDKPLKHQNEEQVILTLEKVTELTSDSHTVLDIMKRLYLNALVSNKESEVKG